VSSGTQDRTNEIQQTKWPSWGVARCVRGGAVAHPTWLAGGLQVDEVFTSTTGAPRGGGQARWHGRGLTLTSYRQRGGRGNDLTVFQGGEEAPVADGDL
jgi:hypothetical protein